MIAEAATRPALAAVIPSNEARTPRYFFKLVQNRITKNMRNVPGRNIPIADMKLEFARQDIIRQNALRICAKGNTGMGAHVRWA